MATYSNKLPISFNQSTNAFDFGLTNITASSMAGAEATASWAGALAIQGGTSTTSAINGGDLKLNGGGATGGGGAVKGTVLMGTDASLTSAVTIGHSAANVVIGSAAVATTATVGFPYLVSCAGTPTGVPATITGRVPMVVDTTGVKIWFYIGGAWKGVVVA